MKKLELDLSVKLGPLKLKNPIMSASGTFGYGLELINFCPPQNLGAAITKGVSLKPWGGNEGPRMFEVASGLINAIGLENMGVEVFIEKALPPLKKLGAVVCANILGNSLDEYAALAKILSKTEVDFLEVNISCPNVAKGGLSFGADARSASEVTAAVYENLRGKPFMVKLAPLTADIVAVAKAVEKQGATAVSLINTIPSMGVDLEKRTFQLANKVGGLSGPAIKPVALRQVWLCAQNLEIPVVGVGGIMTAKDALEFILVGATAVEIGTATLIDPRAPMVILKGIEEWLLKEGLSNLEELRGSIKA